MEFPQVCKNLESTDQSAALTMPIIAEENNDAIFDSCINYLLALDEKVTSTNVSISTPAAQPMDGLNGYEVTTPSKATVMKSTEFTNFNNKTMSLKTSLLHDFVSTSDEDTSDNASSSWIRNHRSKRGGHKTLNNKDINFYNFMSQMINQTTIDSVEGAIQHLNSYDLNIKYDPPKPKKILSAQQKQAKNDRAKLKRQLFNNVRSISALFVHEIDDVLSL